MKALTIAHDKTNIDDAKITQVTKPTINSDEF
jgi:hypothetical protein